MKKVFLLLLYLILVHGFVQAQKTKLKPGKKAPVFLLETNTDTELDFNRLLREDNTQFLLVHFFNGTWNKYDQTFLKILNESNSDFKAKHCKVVLISREKAVYINQYFKANNITLPVGLDNDWTVISQYGTAVKISRNYIPLKHEEYERLNAKHTGSKDGIMTVPATFLINKEGKITWMHYDPDYRQRTTIESIKEQL